MVYALSMSLILLSFTCSFNQLTTGIYGVCTEYVTHSVVVHL